ncbi:uncharacterized protein K02A2.6-like [Coccinella septempunctata]|uniref:uncharacterized protein K02A2.6-like n=1 Tax=Coccinella septempunctata TaxID=41139 RepID=UPI001D08DC41|nr:uncharacterized protein K02A2.6-like [Coccinella septempunctata]
MKERLRSKVWWPGIDREADTFVHTCDECQKVVSYFSKFIECKVMKKTTAEATTAFLQEVFARFGYCYSITSDNGPPFNSEEFSNFCKELGIIHYTTPPYWAQANGDVERQNRSINKIIKIAILKDKNYKRELNNYLLMYHSTPHSVTNKIPTMRERIEVPGVRERDAYQKAMSSERHKYDSVPDKAFEVGDEVLAKRPFSHLKSDSKFEGDTGTVT